MIYEKHFKSFTSLVVWACNLTCLQFVALKMDQRIWPQVFGFIWSWYICYSTKLCQRRHNFWALRFYCELVFENLEHGGGSLAKQSSNLVNPLITCLLISIRSKDWYFSQAKHKDDSHSSARKVYVWCLHSGHYYKQTRPLIRVWPNCSIWNWPKLEVTFPLCCFIAQSDH